MADIEALRKRRDKLASRERKVDGLIQADELDLAKILSEIKEERAERAELEDRRHDLRDAIEAEIEADEEGEGERSEHWEEWAEARRDELADLIDSSEARVHRLLERAAKEKDALADLRKRDSKLEERIAIVEKRIERKSQSGGQLTADFHIAEFDCRNGTPVPPYMEASLRALCIQHLQPLRDSGGSVHVNSGYRTAAYNASIGGASQSYHIYDIRKTAPAADHIQSGRSAPQVQQWHEGHNPFDGMGFYSGFTHGDDRGYRSRWYGAG